MASSTFRNAFLLLRTENLRDVHKFLPAVAEAAERTTERLLILVLSDLFDHDSKLNHTASWNDVQSLLASVYVEATCIAYKLDKPFLEVDVLLRGRSDDEMFDLTRTSNNWNESTAVFRLGDEPTDKYLPPFTATLPILTLEPAEQPPSIERQISSYQEPSGPHPSTFPVVALGGTFDHLHSGHKILLSMAGWIAHEKVIVGITDDKLLKNKTHKEVLEPLVVRMEHVRAFLEFFKPGLVYDIVPIDDVYGPTATDPNIQALVVSKETLGGADSIAKVRREKDFPPLECFVIDVISATSRNLDAEDVSVLREKKMSSTFIREYIVSRGLQQSR